MAVTIRPIGGSTWINPEAVAAIVPGNGAVTIHLVGGQSVVMDVWGAPVEEAARQIRNAVMGEPGAGE